MSGEVEQWRWFGDPGGGASGFEGRVLRDPGTPRLSYRRMVWALVREPAPATVVEPDPAPLRRLRYEADMVPVPNLLVPLKWYERRTDLQPKVEALTLVGGNLSNAESALADLLARAAAEIDSWLARNEFH